MHIFWRFFLFVSSFALLDFCTFFFCFKCSFPLQPVHLLETRNIFVNKYFFFLAFSSPTPHTETILPWYVFFFSVKTIQTCASGTHLFCLSWMIVIVGFVETIIATFTYSAQVSERIWNFYWNQTGSRSFDRNIFAGCIFCSSSSGSFSFRWDIISVVMCCCLCWWNSIFFACVYLGIDQMKANKRKRKKNQKNANP